MPDRRSVESRADRLAPSPDEGPPQENPQTTVTSVITATLAGKRLTKPFLVTITVTMM